MLRFSFLLKNISLNSNRSAASLVFQLGKAAYRSLSHPRAAFFWLLGLVQFKFQPLSGSILRGIRYF
jgi:hypothetical protein